MGVKPSEQSILEAYSLSELLDLIKEKADMDAEEQLNIVRQHLNDLSQSMGGSIQRSPIAEPKVSGRGRGRPKKVESDDIEVDKAPGARRGRKKTPLGQMLQEVLGKMPMNIEEIMDALKSQGYKSKSKDPRRILYLELKKQVEIGNINKVGRGMYSN